MNRFVPLLLCVLIGCASANGSFTAQPNAKAKVTPSVKDDPVPSMPIPPAPVIPAFLEVDDCTAEIGELVIVVPRTNCTKIRYKVVDKGLSLIPQKYLNPEITTDMLAWAMIPGDYRVAVSGYGNGDLVDPVIFVISVQGARPPPGPQPPVPPVPPGPGPLPPAPIQATNLLIYTFEDAFARTPAITDMLNNPFWTDLQLKGHKFEKFNTNNTGAMAAFKPQIDANGGLPCIVIMELSTRKWLNKDPADLKLPADSASLKSRIAKFTNNVP